MESKSSRKGNLEMLNKSTSTNDFTNVNYEIPKRYNFFHHSSWDNESLRIYEEPNTKSSQTSFSEDEDHFGV